MNILLDMLALGAVLSGILVITAKNPVISVLFLISVFINVAGYLVLMGVAYLGLVYIIVYVGAIAILFLFVIMMLNLRLVELLDTGKAYTQNLPLGTIIGSLFFYELLSISAASDSLFASDNSFINDPWALLGRLVQLPFDLFYKINDMILSFTTSTTGPVSDLSTSVHTAYNPMTADLTFNSYLQIESIGQGLYTYSALWLIVASFILLLSMVGPIILCLNPTTTRH